MNGGMIARLLAWSIALILVALPIVGVLNGWFASERWPLTKLAVRAEFNHVSAEQIRAAAQPQLGAGFFAIKLDAVRAAVAKLPWVEHVEVRKRWPDSIDLVVYEQQPYARWGEDRLINRQGGIFSVAGGNDLQGLPRLAGPDDRVAEVVEFYAGCVREFSGSGLTIAAARLSPRGGWSLDLASGAVIEMGRENAREHLDRFLDVWPRLAGSHPAAPVSIDLRYENGFAIRWTADSPPPSGNGEKPTADARALTAVQQATFALSDFRFPTPDSRLFDSPFPISDSRFP